MYAYVCIYFSIRLLNNICFCTSHASLWHPSIRPCSLHLLLSNSVEHFEEKKSNSRKKRLNLLLSFILLVFLFDLLLLLLVFFNSCLYYVDMCMDAVLYLRYCLFFLSFLCCYYFVFYFFILLLPQKTEKGTISHTAATTQPMINNYGISSFNCHYSRNTWR